MAGSSAESMEIQARDSVDDNLGVLDYMDDDLPDSSESSLLPESNQSESDEQIVSTVYLICLTISTGGWGYLAQSLSILSLLTFPIDFKLYGRLSCRKVL
jgi:hypothetical protein